LSKVRGEIFGSFDSTEVNVVSLKKTDEPPDKSSETEVLPAVDGEPGAGRASFLEGNFTELEDGGGDITRMGTAALWRSKSKSFVA
jgi:hypothetical protein